MVILVVSILIIVGLILMVAGFVLPARNEMYDSDRVDAEIREMVRKCSRDYTATCGCLKVLTHTDMEAIYKMAR